MNHLTDQRSIESVLQATIEYMNKNKMGFAFASTENPYNRLRLCDLPVMIQHLQESGALPNNGVYAHYIISAKKDQNQKIVENEQCVIYNRAGKSIRTLTASKLLLEQWSTNLDNYGVYYNGLREKPYRELVDVLLHVSLNDKNKGAYAYDY